MSKFYPLIRRAAARTPWALDPDKMDEIKMLIELKANGLDLPEEMRAEIQAARHLAARARTSRGVAIIPIFGVISYRANLLNEFSGGTSIQQLTGQFREAVNNPDVGTIVLQVASPGGTTDGIPELADEILKARVQKKIIAVADTQAGSAAYWLMSAATEIVVTPSGAVGSIGAYGMHFDKSVAFEKEGIKPTIISAGENKDDGNQFEPLSDEARADFQSKVDAFYGMFVKAVAKGRGVSVGAVRDGFGQARRVLAKDAKAMGMVDRVDTFSNVLARLGVDVGAGQGKRAQVDAPSPMVGEDGPEVFAGVDLSSKDDTVAIATVEEAETIITYAKVYGPPDDWNGLEVVDLDTGEKIENVVEANTEEGWLIRHKDDDDGRPTVINGTIAMEKIEGRFKIQRPATDSEKFAAMTREEATSWVEQLASFRGKKPAEPAHNPRHRRLALLRHA